jgi:hypothetical protein
MKNFEEKLADLMDEVKEEMLHLNRDNSEEDHQFGLLQEIKKELNDTHSEFLTYKRNLTKIAN